MGHVAQDQSRKLASASLTHSVDTVVGNYGELKHTCMNKNFALYIMCHMHQHKYFLSGCF